ncbi:MAG: DMT family transporter [Verrucomicrobiales bacterium]|nr:DMT family transporter [Verrucomicrobiales bacterium]
MFPAFLATLLFSGSVIVAARSTRALGSDRANLWRVIVATLALGAWAHALGAGTGGGAFGMFFVSGCVGFGVGDIALYHCLPRLGPRLAALMVNCLAAPFAAVIEWFWLGTTLTLAEAAFSAAILFGVALALAPQRESNLPAGGRWLGIGLGIIAGLGQGLGAVLSRKGFEISAAAGLQLDGGTAAYQRILGGLAVVLLRLGWLLAMARLAKRPGALTDTAAPPSRQVWPLVLANGLAGPTLGVACFQWALKTTPAAIVLPITATTPLVVIPFTWYFDHDRPGWRALIGGLLAVGGVIGLTLR